MYIDKTDKRYLFTLFMLCALWAMPTHGQIDTTRTHNIGEVVVNERYSALSVKSTAPTQVLSADDLNALNVLLVSDAVKHFAGVTVKDYGGIGGLKTVSLRSLGANHTAVSYDGIALSDCQSGQIDLSRISIECIDMITLNNGQSDRIFQPARMFASAGTLNLQTQKPVFKDNKRWNGKAMLKAGSFGLVNPVLGYEQQLGRRWAMTLNGEWMSAKGEYPYKIDYGNQKDSTERRNNTAVKTLRTEGEVFGQFSDNDEWRLKAYYYQTSRQLPGPTILYNSYSDQHLWERNFFTQSHYRKRLSPCVSLQAALKYNHSYQHYINPRAMEDNNYRQQEYYLTTSVLFRPVANLSFSLATDGVMNKLDADTYNFADPTRYSWLTALAGKYEVWRLNLSASLLATMIKEEVKLGESGSNHRKLSPYTGFSLKLLESEQLYARAFYKNVFRLPTFNDLYYSRVGNVDLKPENTTQYNVGITYSKPINSRLTNISTTVDGFYNRVTNKIIAVPTQSLFIWSMTNLGVVDIKGIDATLAGDIDFGQKFLLHLSGSYSYQHALDMTTPGSKTYKHQIAYTPRSFGSANAAFETPWVTLAYSLIASGYRYILGQNIEQNKLNGYADHSLSASRDITIKKTTARLSVELLNLLNNNYEVVKSYPMPGRSFRVTLAINY